MILFIMEADQTRVEISLQEYLSSNISITISISISISMQNLSCVRVLGSLRNSVEDVHESHEQEQKKEYCNIER